MRIYIPTRGRVDRQRTVERLGLSINKVFATTLVCPPDEAKELRARYADEFGVYVTPCKRDGIAATRQFIIDEAERGDLVLMLDDDLPTWCARNQPDLYEHGVVDAKYHKASTLEIMAGLRDFAKRMETGGFAHGAIGHRLFCQVHPEVYYNTRMLRALAYDVSTLRADRVKFRIPVMEDFDMQLQLLTLGYPNMVYNRLVQDQYSTNVDGGCAAYRTPEVQAKAAHELKRLWPDFVSVVERAPKREWGGFDTVRTDVKVNWRKAAKQGGASK